MKSRNVCCHSVQNLLSSSSLSKNMKIKIYRNITLPFLMWFWPSIVVNMWNMWWISTDGKFSSTRNLITMRCSTLRGTFCSLITLATPRQDWTRSNPSRKEGGGCGFTLSRSHSCCVVRLVYIQISPGHIWTTLYQNILLQEKFI